MATAEAPPTVRRRRPTFHPLRVARVERLTDDAVAVTFDIPDELAEDYRFKPGQALTLRRVVDGRDERRSYSICAPMGAPPRVGVREVPGGFFSSYLVHEVQPGDRVDVLSAAPEGGATAQVVATRLAVLSVPDVGDAAGEGALVVVAAGRSTAARLAAAAVTGRLSVVVHGR